MYLPTNINSPTPGKIVLLALSVIVPDTYVQLRKLVSAPSETSEPNELVGLGWVGLGWVGLG